MSHNKIKNKAKDSFKKQDNWTIREIWQKCIYKIKLTFSNHLKIKPHNCAITKTEIVIKCNY